MDKARLYPQDQVAKPRADWAWNHRGGGALLLQVFKIQNT